MNFDRAVEVILKMEGGYINHPEDPGGETNFGISKRSHPNTDIKNLTKDLAKIVYKEDYWDRCKCDELPEPLRLIIFDCAVNQGRTFASKLLQKIVKTKKDGVIGPETIKATHKKNQFKTLNEYAQGRKEAYFKNRNFNVFGKGWLTRLIHILTEYSAQKSESRQKKC